MQSESEKELYEGVKQNLQELFQKIGKCYLEITAEGKISNELKRMLDDLSLYIINVERFSPDIMGYVIEEELSESKDIIVVEIKPSKIRIKDIFQAKIYGEIFNAKYTLLISSESIAEEIRRFLEKRPEILSHSAGYKSVITAQFDKKENIIKSWYPSPPFESFFSKLKGLF